MTEKQERQGRAKQILEDLRTHLLAKEIVAGAVIQGIKKVQHHKNVTAKVQTAIKTCLTENFVVSFSPFSGSTYKIQVWGGAIQMGDSFQIFGETYAELIEQAERFIFPDEMQNIGTTIQNLGQLDTLEEQIQDLKKLLYASAPMFSHISALYKI